MAQKPGPRSRPARAAPVAVGLSREAILAAALDEIDSKGLAGFSLRGLARSLGVNGSVIVWHVGNRDTVIAEVVRLVLRDSVPPRLPGQSWQDWLRSLFSRFRDAVRRHPNTAPLIGADTVANLRPDLALVEAVLSVLVEAGVPDERLCETYNAIQAALVGFVTQELARMPTEDLPSWQSSIQANLATVDTARFPHVARLLPRLTNRAFVLRWQNGAAAPMDSSFETFVDLILAGLEASLPRAGNRGATGALTKS
ncbi:TetR/AcrR family transcriptional regulator C-terminal domain-containing protein [Roseomonas marmotae]|uniref:TetR/AcrR family transcriptional regulator n=1 Tax=Roseomonas marmotae TaxID=2768161 RepID=A0ABS3KDH4_9PROT|nr:TetR/AcrR family transcriptional regulator C-terminal domain-containing protein [Roseomonas marmotae]MBO1075490.1 TetR/AcrR family transcriptional regulator [Roseomonas marmotae]QTI81436.1 TetR/AcrR family transcriptional regulator [Roseomonas marmotae]